MLESLRRRQTLASFDYQWGELPEGAMLWTLGLLRLGCDVTAAYKAPGA